MDWQMLFVLAAVILVCDGKKGKTRGRKGMTRYEKISRLPNLNTCGKSVLPATIKLIEDKPANLGSYPWVAAIGYRNRKLADKWFCAGSLITDQHIITAAHCVLPEPTEGYNVYTVRLGVIDLNKTSNYGASPINRGIRNIITHQQYNDTIKQNDIAIIKLKKKVQFTDIIKPICLPPPSFNTNMFVGYFPVVVGWGKSTYWPGDKSPTHLMETEVEIQDTDQCKKNITLKPENIVIDNTVICTVSHRNETCKGDSGGPLMIYMKTKNAPPESTGNMYLMGVLSYASSCAVSGTIGLYSRVSQHMPWIIDNLDFSK